AAEVCDLLRVPCYFLTGAAPTASYTLSLHDALPILTSAHQHGDIVVAFVPDEEIGLKGAKALDLKRFDVDFAWTIDCCELGEIVDRKSTRLNSSHVKISYAVFCLKKKTTAIRCARSP